MKPHPDCSDIVYDQPSNESLNQKIWRIQYNAAFTIKVTIEVRSQSKLYNKLSFESPKFRRWFRKLYTFYKIKTIGVSERFNGSIL